ncbi:hypothetical protein J3R83DRAFT_1451 [Lanmaoa asiatica]|nr:hypothetical protein J3R83DRAFT_1451 [Lanmaoa asiatica]
MNSLRAKLAPKQVATAAEKLAAAATHRTGFEINIPASRSLAQLTTMEGELKDSMKALKDHNCIFGTPLTIDELPALKKQNRSE